MQQLPLGLYVGSLLKRHLLIAAKYYEEILSHRIAHKAHRHLLQVDIITRETKTACS